MAVIITAVIVLLIALVPFVWAMGKLMKKEELSSAEEDLTT